MAIHKGSEGTVKSGTDVIAGVKSWSLEQTVDTLETTVIGNTSRSYTTGLNTFSGSMDVFWDPADTGQATLLVLGASVTVNLYPEGETSGDTYYSGTVLISSISQSVSPEGLIEASISFQGTGDLSITTITGQSIHVFT